MISISQVGEFVANTIGKSYHHLDDSKLISTPTTWLLAIVIATEESKIEEPGVDHPAGPFPLLSRDLKLGISRGGFLPSSCESEACY